MFNEIKRQVQLGDLVVVAGQPFSGRTTFAMQLLTELWWWQSDQNNFTISGFYSPIINKLEVESLCDKHGINIPFYMSFVPTHPLTLKELETTFMGIQKTQEHYEYGFNRENKILYPIYLIDMFHFLDEPLKANENETVRISKIITSLKQIATKLNAVVILTSEINMESVRKKRDDLLCLRDSIKIGSVADFVFLLKSATSTVKVLKNKRGLRAEFENPVWNSPAVYC